MGAVQSAGVGLLVSAWTAAAEPAAAPGALYAAGKWLACTDYPRGKLLLVGPDGTGRWQVPAEAPIH